MPIRLILLTTLMIGATTVRGESRIVASPSDAGVTDSLSNPQSWRVQDVQQWAAANAAAANLLETERRAAQAGLDRHDQEACRRASLVQAVLTELAKHERNRAAADAMVLYYRIVGVEQQQELLAEADEIFRTLIDLAERAADLDLADGNRNELRRRQLEIKDSSVQADYGSRKMRRQLAQLTGRPPQQASIAILVDPLPSDVSLPEASSAVETALTERHDLRAIRLLCRRTGSETLPAMRQLLSAIQPGLGLSAAAASKTGLLFHHSDRANQQESAWRCRQCQQLLQTRIDQVRSEVEVALWDLQAAEQRAELAAEKTELARDAVAEQAKAVQLNESPTASDLLARLEAIEIEAAQIDRQVERAVAEIRLRESQGLLAE